MIFSVDFNIFFNSKLEAKIVKYSQQDSLIELIQRLDTFGIWRSKNPLTQTSVFKSNYLSQFIKH